MARQVDAAKQQAWRKRFQRDDHCGLSVAAFCEAEGVSVPSFYQWRRKLAARHGAAASGSSEPSPPTFVPVRVVQAASAASRASARVAIRLPNGTVVRVPSDDLPALEAAIAAAGCVAARQEDAPC